MLKPLGKLAFGTSTSLGCITSSVALHSQDVLLNSVLVVVGGSAENCRQNGNLAEALEQHKAYNRIFFIFFANYWKLPPVSRASLCTGILWKPQHACSTYLPWLCLDRQDCKQQCLFFLTVILCSLQRGFS